MESDFPSQPGVIHAAIDWLQQTLTGSLAMTVAVIAIAWFGLMMMSGRLPRRRGLQLLLGCFIIFGASLIASGIINTLQAGATDGSEVAAQSPPPPPAPIAVQRAGPVSPYDPYAGAALPPRR
jgi:type IV secretion system protein VirB2